MTGQRRPSRDAVSSPQPSANDDLIDALKGFVGPACILYLRLIGVRTVRDLAQLSFNEVAHLPYMGKKRAEAIDRALGGYAVGLQRKAKIGLFEMMDLNASRQTH